VEQQLSDPAVYADKARFTELDRKYKDLTTRLEEQTRAYDETFEQMLELEAKLG